MHKIRTLYSCFLGIKGYANDGQWERNFPDGCPGLVVNLGDTCRTDNGSVSMHYGKTYVVGAMTSFKDSFIDDNTHLLGVCLEPAVFSSFYSYSSQHELINSTIEFDQSLAFSTDKIRKQSTDYLNRFFVDRIRNTDAGLQAVIEDIHHSNGGFSIYDLAKRNATTVRQLERKFKAHVGVTPKEYSNIIRFQNVLPVIKHAAGERSLSDIAFEYGFYDHAHLTREVKKNTGLVPSQL